MRTLSEDEFLAELRARGARRLRKVHFRRNRRRIWSLTRGATVLNIHVGYRRATDEILDHFALIAREPRGGRPALVRARSAVQQHPPLHRAMESIRRNSGSGGPNCATPAQQAYLDALYALLNTSAFDDRLPDGLPIRLSRRMRSTWGAVKLTHLGGVRTVHELALNLDLMLEENDDHRIEIMLHEMAHIEAFLEDGDAGHGPAWRRIAQRVGCHPRATLHDDFHRRADRRASVNRVPPLPAP